MNSTLALYGHPFSSYTWKVLIALYEKRLDFDFRILDQAHPEHGEQLAAIWPLGKFPVLEDDGLVVVESSIIIEHLDQSYPKTAAMIPMDEIDALDVRLLDRLFDNHVMAPMQAVVEEHIRSPEAPDMARIGEARARLSRSYSWLETWLEDRGASDRITLVECAAAPSLFYADWVEPIGDAFPRLKAWRAHLLALPPVARCVEEARPYRAYFPPGAPDRD